VSQAVTPVVASPPGLAVVRALSWIVPDFLRAEWVAEWNGELAYAWRDARRRGEPPALTHGRLLWRSLGASLDALWLWRRHGAMNMIGLDLRYAARSLRRRPGFSAVVILTLALGIGATTAVFSVVDGVLLRPLAFHEPERLVRLASYPTDGNTEKVGGPAFSYPDFNDFRSQSRSFEHVAAVRGWQVTLTAPGTQPARIRTAYVTPSLFPTLGVRPILGRAFLPADAQPGAPPLVLLGHDIWQQRYGASPDVLGTRIVLDGTPTTVIGVLPPDVRLTADRQIWQPLIPGPLERARGAHRLSVVARLKPSVTLASANVESRTIARRLEEQYPDDNTSRGVRVEPLRDAIVGDARPALLVLFGAVTLVLLIGCTNLASLFLARATAREREMAVRAALGAGEGRLMRQWLTESLLLSLAGGLTGLAVAWAGMRALLAFVPRTVPRADEITLGLPVLVFLLGVSVLTGIIFGVLPAFQRRGSASVAQLRDGARGSTTGRTRRRLRSGLVVTEVALATILVAGAALLIKDFWRLHSTQLPFKPDGLVVAQLQLPPTRYDSSGKIVRFYERLREEVAGTTGVRSATFAFEHPISEGWTSSFAIVGRPAPPTGLLPESRIRPVWPGYFRTIGLPLLRGRDVTDRDRFGAPGVVIVNEAFVRRHFPREEPIGQTINRGQPWWPGQPTQFAIVGVVADEPFLGLGREADPATYYPHAQFPFNDMWLVARVDGDAAAIAPALRERIWRVDPDLPIERIATLNEVLGASVAAPRFNAALLAIFAAAALLLAAVGIYGVLSYTVTQRTGEIGVRMALGAERRQVVRDVVQQGTALALVGAGIGLVGAFGLARVLRTLLVGVSTQDPAIFAAVPGTLILVAILASWLPARRASKIQPVEALRYD
jgi:putative ABC transport system permease protein